MSQYKHIFSLRVVHPTRDLQGIYNELSLIPGFLPRRIWKVGETRKTPQGNPMVGEYKESYCYFMFFEKPMSCDIETLPNALGRVAEQLFTKKELLREHVSSGGGLSFFISWFFEKNSGDMLDLDLLKKITDLGIGLDFDIYPDNTDKLIDEL